MYPSLRTGCDFRKGFVGGERGCSAALSCRCCDEEADEDAEGVEGESMKQMKPKASRAASMRLIGLVRRIERATAMAVSHLRMLKGEVVVMVWVHEEPRSETAISSDLLASGLEGLVGLRSSSCLPQPPT
jgi:hypothetical protein